MHECCQNGAEKQCECGTTGGKCGMGCGHCMNKMMRVGKALFALPMGVFGIFHFMGGTAMAQMVLAGWPAATFLVYLSGAAFLLGAIAILLDKHAKLGAVVISVTLLLIILTLNVPQVMAGGAGQQMAIGELLKNVALLAGGLMVAATSWGMCCLNKKMST